MTLTRDQLGALREKYRTLIELRTTRDALQATGSLGFDATAGSARRVTMRELATRFPGALRELEHFTARELRQREAALEVALESGATEAWMEATAIFHEVLRETLRLRRVSAPARIPTGRLLHGTWDTVATRLRISRGEAERLVYPR